MSFSSGLRFVDRLSRRGALGAAASFAAIGPAWPAAPVVRLGDQKGGLEALLHAAAELEGLPFRLEIAEFPAAAPLLEALNEGAVDIAWAGDAPTTFALANGVPAHIVSAHRSNGAGTSLLVKGDSPIRSAAELAGRRIGTSRGSIGHALVLAALRANKLPLDSVRYAWLLPVEAKLALESGDIDVWATWGVFVAQAQLIDRYRAIADGSRGMLSGLGYLAASDAAIADKRAALRDLITRAARAARWANANVDAYARYWSGLVGVSFEVARLAFTTAPTLAVPIDASVVADQQRTADLYTEARLISHGLDVRGFFDWSFNDAVAA
jgi:sulfonate transport system substrate-binding protein